MLKRARPLPVVAIAALGLALPSAASGGGYRVAQCDGALNPTPGQAAQERASDAYTLTAACAGGTGLQVESLLQTPAGSYGRWIWRAPSGSVFTRIRADATLIDGSGEQARLTAVRPGGQVETFGGPAGEFAPYSVLGEFTEFRSALTCTGPGPCGGALSGAAVRNVALDLDDRSPPSPSFTGGSLFASDAVRGDQTVALRAADEGGGVRRLELRVNGELVRDDVRDCQLSAGVATALQPCAPEALATATLATSAPPFATGANQVRLCASDLGVNGNPNGACTSADVFVDDLCPTSSVAAGSRLSGRFAGDGRTVTVRSDRRVAVEGVLTSDSGDGIRGARVCALTRALAPGEPYRVADVAKTRGDGTYKLRLPPGASREVFVDRALEGAVLMRAGLRTNARVRPTFQIKSSGNSRTRGGGRIRFRGKLPGPGCDGRIVKVQAKVGKRQWQVFRGIRTSDECVYRIGFKLSSTSRRTRYQFRVRIPEQRDYPYAAGSSPVRGVVVAPD